MALMLSKTYEALIAAGAPEDKAREAAEELAGYENRLASIDNRLSNVEGKLTVIIWAMGIDAAATIAILGVLLRAGRGLP
ncbi:MAG: integrase [Alphaproteobacteria bacterium]|nr:integrase [Alphaproteobacteria bacterium]